jgi:hypothetical protein
VHDDIQAWSRKEHALVQRGKKPHLLILKYLTSTMASTEKPSNATISARGMAVSGCNKKGGHKKGRTKKENSKTGNRSA